MSFNRPLYDPCEAHARTRQSVGPMQYRMYAGSNINGNSCNVVPTTKHFSMVDINSELRGLNRFHSECGRKMYNPDGSIRKYGLGNTAISTFDARANVAINPAVCPDVTRNLIFNSGIVRPVHPGYTLPTGVLGCGSARS